MKYKVGDKVKVRSNLTAGERYANEGELKACCCTEGMRIYRGKEATIKRIVFGNRYQLDIDNCTWCWVDEMLEHAVMRKIVITTDGTETLARLYENGKVVKSATAKCAPEDEFDFNIGARLAFDRLVGEEKTAEKWRVVHRPARVGDYIRLKGINFTFNRVGDILKVADVTKHFVDVKACDHPRDTDAKSDYLWHYLHDLYEVIEPCTAEKKEEYYNGKVVCVKAGGFFAYTVGKIYEFKDGNVINDNGVKALNIPIKTLEEWNKEYERWATFIPLVEETKGE